MGKMEKMETWEAEHVNWSGIIHVFLGLGIAWLISLGWHYSLIALTLGIVFLVAGIIGLIYSLLAKQ